MKLNIARVFLYQVRIGTKFPHKRKKTPRNPIREVSHSVELTGLEPVTPTLPV